MRSTFSLIEHTKLWMEAGDPDLEVRLEAFSPLYQCMINGSVMYILYSCLHIMPSFNAALYNDGSDICMHCMAFPILIGSFSKKLGASSYLLELVPDIQVRAVHSSVSKLNFVILILAFDPKNLWGF